MLINKVVHTEKKEEKNTNTTVGFYIYRNCIYIECIESQSLHVYWLQLETELQEKNNASSMRTVKY